MKRIYATIFLLSFMIGAMQPVMPMIYFLIDGGELTHIVAPGFFEKPYSSEGKYCTFDLGPFDDFEENNSNKLLDTDYYPLPVNVDNTIYDTILNEKFAGHITLSQDALDLFLYSGTPPPRIA